MTKSLSATMTASSIGSTCSILVTNVWDQKKETLVIGSYEAKERCISDIFSSAQNQSVQDYVGFEKFLKDAQNMSSEDIRGAADYMKSALRNLLDSKFFSETERMKVKPMLKYSYYNLADLYEYFEILRQRIEACDDVVSYIFRKDNYPFYRPPLFVEERPEDIVRLEIETQSQILARALVISQDMDTPSPS